MGYETELVIGVDTGSTFNADQNEIYFQVYGTIDMCKMGRSAIHDLPTVNETPEKKRWYFFPPAGDGDAQVFKDRYGAFPRPVPIEDVIAALEKDVETSDFRRFKWALGMLRAMSSTGNEQLSVLSWGY